jgi:hypothetical protein
MIPQHDVHGFLPVGTHAASWTELVARFGGNARRRGMLQRLHAALDHLAAAGCTTAFLGGSFATTKRDPGDLDVVWDVTGVNPDLVHPMFMSEEGLREVWDRFAGHYFPSILTEERSRRPFVEFFSQKDGRPVGIIKLDLTSLPDLEDA